jgi:hypothetical protein
LPKPVADSHAKDAPHQIPSNFRTSPGDKQRDTISVPPLTCVELIVVLFDVER